MSETLFPGAVEGSGRNAYADAAAKFAREHQREKRRDLDHCLAYLEKLTQPAVLRKGDSEGIPSIPPTAADFRRLNDAVFSLAKTLRKKRLSFLRAVTLIETTWPNIQLGSRIERLISRTSDIYKSAPPPPHQPPAVKHLSHMLDRLRSDVRWDKKAKDFKNVLGRLLAGGDLSGVSWSRYKEFLWPPNQTALPLESDVPLLTYHQRGIRCLIRYLELERAWFIWDKTVARYLRATEHLEAYYDWLEEITGLNEPKALAEARRARETAAKDAAKQRSRRYRAKVAKKTSRKSVTANKCPTKGKRRKSSIAACYICDGSRRV